MLHADVAELVDALASGASVRKDVEVQVLSWASKKLISTRVSAFLHSAEDLNLGFERVDGLLARIKKTLSSVAAGA